VNEVNRFLFSIINFQCFNFLPLLDPLFFKKRGGLSSPSKRGRMGCCFFPPCKKGLLLFSPLLQGEIFLFLPPPPLSSPSKRGRIFLILFLLLPLSKGEDIGGGFYFFLPSFLPFFLEKRGRI
jgi:hypothetical protein